jgi:hypothetical protein
MILVHEYEKKEEHYLKCSFNALNYILIIYLFIKKKVFKLNWQ